MVVGSLHHQRCSERARLWPGHRDYSAFIGENQLPRGHFLIRRCGGRAASTLDVRMAPHRCSLERGHCPCGVVDEQTSAANFDFQPARGFDVKRHHMVIIMLAQCRGEARAILCQAIVRGADHVEVGDLHHEVMIHAFARILGVGQRMVSWIAVGKYPTIRKQAAVAQPKAEQVHVEMRGCFDIRVGHHDMAKP